MSKKIATSGAPRRPRSSQTKSASNAPAKLIDKIVSTRQVDAALNHSGLQSRSNDESNAVASETRAAKKSWNMAVKRTNAMAEGNLAVASETSPNGRETIALSQCENGGFAGTSPLYDGGNSHCPVSTMA